MCFATFPQWKWFNQLINSVDLLNTFTNFHLNSKQPVFKMAKIPIIILIEFHPGHIAASLNGTRDWLFFFDVSQQGN